MGNLPNCVAPDSSLESVTIDNLNDQVKRNNELVISLAKKLDNLESKVMIPNLPVSNSTKNDEIETKVEDTKVHVCGHTHQP